MPEPSTVDPQPSELSDLEIAIAFEHAVIYHRDVDLAMRYAHPDIEVREAPSTPYRRPLIGKEGLLQLREDVSALCRFEGEAETQYFQAAPGLVVGRIRRTAFLKSTDEPFNFWVTEWITVTDGLVSDVEVFYFENAPLVEEARRQR